MVQAGPRRGEAPPPACGLATGTLLRADFVPAPPRVEQGRLHLPGGPGLGVVLPGPDAVTVHPL